jgi:hypothetical protein
VYNPEAQVFNPTCEFHDSLKYQKPEVRIQNPGEIRLAQRAERIALKLRKSKLEIRNPPSALCSVLYARLILATGF